MFPWPAIAKAGRLKPTTCAFREAVIQRALNRRRDLLSMHFDPLAEQGIRPEMSIAALELRSVVCVPLIQIRSGTSEETRVVASIEDTVGLLYMDSREAPADLSAGNRELLQTLAIEASTILENARLIEEERVKVRMEDELKIARDIQQGLLPAALPSDGWFRAAGSSLPSTQVGGDYFDVRQVSPDLWAAVVADVSGKGVSSALLASLLQGAFLMAAGASSTSSHRCRAQHISSGAHARRKIRDRVLLHAGLRGSAQLRERGPSRAVPGEPGRPPAQASHLGNAGGHDRRRAVSNGPDAAGAGRQSRDLSATVSPRRRTPRASSSIPNACACACATTRRAMRSSCTRLCSLPWTGSPTAAWFATTSRRW